jgi:hypothetical protein
MLLADDNYPSPGAPPLLGPGAPAPNAPSPPSNATLKDPATTGISRGWCPLMGLTLLYLWLACLDPLTLTRRQTDPPSPHRRQL